MAVDSSALVAIALSEPDADAFQAHLIANEPLICGHVALEVLMVPAGRDVPEVRGFVDRLLDQTGVRLLPFDGDMTVRAQQAFLDFGKGRHPARLNFGDCMSYAVAKSLAIPLLWKGDDFALTDIERAI